MSSDPEKGTAKPRPLGWIGLFLAGAVVIAAFAWIAASSTTPQTGAAASTPFAPGVSPASASLLEMVHGDRKQAPGYQLTDQNGAPMSASEFRGRPVVLTFNDDQCEDLCTLLAEDVVRADTDLGTRRDDVAFVSINANPYFTASSDVASWTDEHGLSSLPNWYFGTAGAAELGKLATAFGVDIEADPVTKNVVHGTQIFFIDPRGATQAIGQFGSDSANTAAFAHAMARMAVDLIPAAHRPKVAGPSLPLRVSGGNNVGDTPAPFTLPALGGGAAITDRPDGSRFTVLDFWSSTCTACRASMPELESEYQSLGTQVSFLGVAVDPDAGAARAFADSVAANYPLALDSSGTVSGAFQITGLPYTVILDPRGKVVIRHPGTMTKEQLDYILRDLDPSLGSGSG